MWFWSVRSKQQLEVTAMSLGRWLEDVLAHTLRPSGGMERGTRSVLRMCERVAGLKIDVIDVTLAHAQYRSFSGPRPFALSRYRTKGLVHFAAHPGADCLG